jgi:hypothetical protein
VVSFVIIAGDGDAVRGKTGTIAVDSITLGGVDNFVASPAEGASREGSDSGLTEFELFCLP